MVGTIAPALHVLCEHLIDYAGTFPPAALTFEAACDNYARYRSGPEAWLLGKFVSDSAHAPEVPESWPLSLLANSDDPRADVIECKQVLHTSRPTYCEVSLEDLPEVKRIESFAKMRCSGAASDQIAAFLRRCAELDLPFKLTAGLHAPLRRNGVQGFVNVFAAAVFARQSFPALEDILEESDPAAFHLTDRLTWRDHSVSTEEIRRARHEFAHSFGSCSFDEPVDGLKQMGWL